MDRTGGGKLIESRLVRHGIGWPILLMLSALATAGCGTSLPGGYRVTYGDRGKAWLSNPDGSIAHGALIKQLLKDDRHILLITFATTLGGEIDGPRPLDGNCYVALYIDADQRRMRQVRLAEARRLSANMTSVVSYDRSCLQGMPTS